MNSKIRKTIFFSIVLGAVGLVLLLLVFQLFLRPRWEQFTVSATATAAVETQPQATTWNGLRIEILEVRRDGWSWLHAHNQFNDPPLPDRRMLLLFIKLTNLEEKSDKFIAVTASDFKIIGGRNTVYSTYGEDTRCGVVPDELDGVLPRQSWMSGHICVQVPQDERDFKLIYEPTGDDHPAVSIDVPNGR